jgi:hypothetical protein
VSRDGLLSRFCPRSVNTRLGVSNFAISEHDEGEIAVKFVKAVVKVDLASFGEQCLPSMTASEFSQQKLNLRKNRRVVNCSLTATAEITPTFDGVEC